MLIYIFGFVICLQSILVYSLWKVRRVEIDPFLTALMKLTQVIRFSTNSTNETIPPPIFWKKAVTIFFLHRNKVYAVSVRTDTLKSPVKGVFVNHDRKQHNLLQPPGIPYTVTPGDLGVKVEVLVDGQRKKVKTHEYLG